MRLLAGLGKIGIGVSLIFGLIFSANARPAIDTMTICYGVNNQDGMAYRTPCIATDTGGAGSNILIYQIKDKEYWIVEEEGGEWLNNEPYETYVRDAFFHRTGDNDEYSYFCYQSASAHFCSKQ
ncbi:hypothetical protein [Psychrobacter sp. I-STPA10]|uniref:hypothetical protein n=1 Tax=Psychrobacter sp. I-STPA10 TaxID=2585769 RepID=UPI001E552445|nr:hypothetical protein [Psychrobacter sp. I-STPA10]